MTNIFPRDAGAYGSPRLSSLDVTATADGSQPSLPVGLSLFVATWIAPPAPIAPRDFTFKVVIGEPSW